ncbi:BatD family protein [Polluticoccus soli]|uniref:BatD family protein n=1 Tax=Polluticoccus soli TaxID=3034150 RepID=UPI0023E1A29C|nr:BatD family protein [Flavipsychrobacter sp. JY13-12]
MTRNSNMWRFSIVLVLLFTACKTVLAQNVVFTTNASAERIGADDQLQISYTIQDAQNLQTINPQGLTKDFRILGGPYQSNNSQVSYANGQMQQTTSISITYVVQARHTGRLVIPGAVAKDADGHTYQSNNLAVQVVQGSLQPRRQQAMQAYDPFTDDPFTAMMQQRQRQLQAMRQQQQQQQQQPQAATKDVDLSKDLFIRVAVDKSKVHVGEQITASYKLYARLPMNVSISKLPSLNGFWTQDFDIPRNNPKPTEEIVNGKKYQVFLLKKSALFPQQTGTLELDPAEAEGVARIVQQVKQRNPFADYFDDPFGFGSMMMNDPFFNDDFFNSVAYRDVKVKLKSTPVKVTVTPLPEKDKPADYGGAVGNFTVSAKTDKTQLTTDDVLNFKMTITGSGNLKLIEAPKLNLPNGLSAFDPQIIDTVTGRSTTISGSKIITYAISANTPGDYEIPSVPFTYFNPQSGAYVTLNTQPVKVRVTQGKNKPSNRNTQLADIHDIDKKPLNNIGYDSKPLFFTAGYWSMYAAPLFAFLGLLVWRRREDELSKDVVALKNRRANKVALKRLGTAQKLLQQNNAKQFYEEVSKAIWLYLSDKLNIPLSELSRERAQEALQARKIPLELQQDAERVIDQCETSLYAPNMSGSAQMSQTYQQAVDVISKLEEVFK